MLRRRIFSAAMASVMALSSVAVVAQAAETTNQVKTKADLEELVTKTYGDSWRADELSNYGSTSQEEMLNALEAADVILADADADEEDYTVAYMMVEAVKDRLKIYSVEELKALIDDCQAIVDTNNIYNEELQDLIYTAESFENLSDALDDANGAVSSTSGAVITEAYEELYGAKTNLSKNNEVTKSQFRNVIKEYQNIIDHTYAYDTWRRGSISDINISTWSGWQINTSLSVGSFGHFYNIALACYDDIMEQYTAIDSIKGLVKTTNEDIYAGYQLAQDAVAVFKAWSADSVNKSTKSGLSALINQYHGQLVYDYATSGTTGFDALLTSVKNVTDVEYVTGGDNVWNTEYVYGWTDGYRAYNYANGVDRLITAEAKIKVANAVYVPLDSDGYWNGDSVVLESGKTEGVKYQKISASTKYDLSKLVDVTGRVLDYGDVSAAANSVLDNNDEYMSGTLKGIDTLGGASGWDFSVSLSEAMSIAEAYLAGNYGTSGIANIDETGVVGTEAKGTSKEFQLVYRYLYYALSEKYDGKAPAEATYTRADIVALIEDVWDLIEDTGDASIFHESNTTLVDARAEAKEWVAASKKDKNYKDNSTEINGKDSTAAYKALYDCYKQLLKEYNALKYSFGDIYEMLADTADKIDDGELDATDALLTAMDEVAYRLSVVSDITQTSAGNYNDNYAFDADRVFNPNNRVVTNITKNMNDDGVEIKTISEELGGVTAKVICHNDQWTSNRNETHYNLITAVNALNDAIAAQAEEEVVLGDANGDGKVNAADATAVLKSIVGLDTVDAAAADYNKDGVVNAADATAILKSIVGLN